MTEASAQELLKNIDKLPPHHYEAVTKALAKWHEAKQIDKAKDSFLDFVKVV